MPRFVMVRGPSDAAGTVTRERQAGGTTSPTVRTYARWNETGRHCNGTRGRDDAVANRSAARSAFAMKSPAGGMPRRGGRSMFNNRFDRDSHGRLNRTPRAKCLIVAWMFVDYPSAARWPGEQTRTAAGANRVGLGTPRLRIELNCTPVYTAYGRMIRVLTSGSRDQAARNRADMMPPSAISHTDKKLPSGCPTEPKPRNNVKVWPECANQAGATGKPERGNRGTSCGDHDKA
jgi:hypothetical protein